MAISIQDVTDRLTAEVAALLRRPAGDIQPERPLHELGLDSMTFVELIVFIEKQFGVNPLEAEISQHDIETLDRLAACVHRMMPAS